MDHERWLDSDGGHGTPLDVRDRPDLVHELRGYDLGHFAMREAYLDGSSLVDVDLTRSDLCEAHLDSADLSNAYAFKAKLDGASLVGSTLKGIELLRASLVEADLRRADLSGATFLKTPLFCADLRGAILATNLDGAWLDGARLGGAVLAGASGIDKVSADWIDVGLATEERLEGAAMREWLRARARS